MPKRALLEKQLKLQRMERKLVSALHDHPGSVDRVRENQLRYAVGLAKIHRFQPGAARHGGILPFRAEVEVTTPELRAFRDKVIGYLGPALLDIRKTDKRLREVNRAFDAFAPRMEEARRRVLEDHVESLSPAELDDEVGIKTLVNVCGGGGGAGWVYVGAWEVLQNAGINPGYIIGSSIGAVLGLFRARTKVADLDEYLALAKSLKPSEIFRFVSMKTRYGLPGIFRLYLHYAIGKKFTREDGEPYRLTDLEIPYEAVVAGIRSGAMKEAPDAYARSHHLPQNIRPGPMELRRQVASQLVRMWAFTNPKMVKEIVIGGDTLTHDFDAIDAAGFSAAIPGILHYDIARDDERMDAILGELLPREDVVALIDGGIANNVPVRTAWKRVQQGKLGTRNCHFLAFDCLSPQLSPGHAWMYIGEAALQLQVAMNRRYMHRHIRFRPTPSVVTLLPSDRMLDRAIGWGRTQMSDEIPLLAKFFDRVEWDGPYGASVGVDRVY